MKSEAVLKNHGFPLNRLSTATNTAPRIKAATTTDVKLLTFQWKNGSMTTSVLISQISHERHQTVKHPANGSALAQFSRQMPRISGYLATT